MICINTKDDKVTLTDLSGFYSITQTKLWQSTLHLHIYIQPQMQTKSAFKIKVSKKVKNKAAQCFAMINRKN